MLLQLLRPHRRGRGRGGRGIGMAQRRQRLEFLLILVGDLLGLLAVADDARGDQHDQLGAVAVAVGAAEQPADHRNPVETGNAGIRHALVLLDQAAEQNGLPALHRHLGAQLALRNGRVAIDHRLRRVALADLLADIHVDQTAGIDARTDVEDDAGVEVVHRVVGVARTQAGADRGLVDRDAVADLDGADLVVHHHHRGRRQRLGIAAGFHRADGHLHVVVEEGIEERFTAKTGATLAERTVLAGGGGAGNEVAVVVDGGADQPLQIPLHAELQLAGELDLENARLDLHLQRHVVELVDGALDLLPLRRPGADQQLVVAVDRADPHAAVAGGVLLAVGGAAGTLVAAEGRRHAARHGAAHAGAAAVTALAAADEAAARTAVQSTGTDWAQARAGIAETAGGAAQAGGVDIVGAAERAAAEARPDLAALIATAAGAVGVDLRQVAGQIGSLQVAHVVDEQLRLVAAAGVDLADPLADLAQVVGLGADHHQRIGALDRDEAQHAGQRRAAVFAEQAVELGHQLADPGVLQVEHAHRGAAQPVHVEGAYHAFIVGQ